MLKTRVKKIWEVAPGGLNPVSTLEDLQHRLLQQRGVAIDQAEIFFRPDYDRDIHDPLQLHDIPAAIDRIFHAIKKSERIIVHGDYDADGITSTAILLDVLQSLGAHVSPYLPHRHDQGYGVNIKTLQGLEHNLDLLITVDCGITALDEVTWLNKRGKDTIIIDHHTPPDELPAARAIVHPAHPDGSYLNPNLCGAGTAWKLAQALLRDKRSPHRGDPDKEKWLLDLTALGTVADMMPLHGENRAIVYFGLEVARRTTRPGLRAVLESRRSTNTLSADDFAFHVIPRLNAAGRLEHPQPALDLLLADSADRAAKLLVELNRINTRRQTLTRRIIKEAESHVNGDPIIFAYQPDWPAGIVGLAAGRLSDRFAKPAIVIGSSDQYAVGSARSPRGVNILELLKGGEEALAKLGGHAQAAGFSLDATNVEAFRALLLKNATSAPADPVSVERATTVINPALLNRTTIDLVDTFAPFGEGNERPRFIINNIPLPAARPVGKDGTHAKYTFAVNDEPFDGIGFGLADENLPKLVGGLVDLIGEIEENEFRGRRNLQLSVRDIAAAGTIEIHEQSNATH